MFSAAIALSCKRKKYGYSSTTVDGLDLGCHLFGVIELYTAGGSVTPPVSRAVG